MANILCVEHAWRHEDAYNPTLKPILEWLHGSFGWGFEYEHRVTSGDNLLYEVGTWAQEEHAAYPILYLANYGDTDELERFAKTTVAPPLAHQLRKSGSPCAIHFGPSHDLAEMAAVYWGQTFGHQRTDRGSTDLLDHLLDKILEKTGAVSVSGYRSGHMDGDGWLKGTVADLTLFANVVESCKGRQSQISSEVLRSAAESVSNRDFVMKTPHGRTIKGWHRPPRRRPPPKRSSK